MNIKTKHRPIDLESLNIPNLQLVRDKWPPKKLHAHLQAAIDLEFWTIPFYMSAMYSIKDRSHDAYQMLRTVVNQEMLHLQCAANIANAFGYSPKIGVPPYVGKAIPHLKFLSEVAQEYDPYTAEIGPLDKEHINAMCLIEHPEKKVLRKDIREILKDDIRDYSSIGALYDALHVGASIHQKEIRGGLKQVDHFSAFYRNMPNLTVSESGSSGLKQILLLIKLIRDQGEGDIEHDSMIPSAFQNTADDTRPQEDHFRKFSQIKELQIPTRGKRTRVLCKKIYKEKIYKEI